MKTMNKISLIIVISLSGYCCYSIPKNSSWETRISVGNKEATRGLTFKSSGKLDTYGVMIEDKEIKMSEKKTKEYKLLDNNQLEIYDPKTKRRGILLWKIKDNYLILIHPENPKLEDKYKKIK